MFNDENNWDEFLQLMTEWSYAHEDTVCIGADGYEFDSLELRRLVMTYLAPSNDSHAKDESQVGQIRAEVIDMLNGDVNTEPDELYEYLLNIQGLSLIHI